MQIYNTRETSTNGSTGSGSSTSGKSAADPTGIANQEVFLQLLVAQIKNQNPLQPSDGIQYLSELAQFTSVEQQLDMKNELTQIRQLLGSLASTPADGGSTEPGSTTGA